jgi:hypothetical protein
MRQGSKADDSLPSSAEVMQTWIYTSTPPYAFMAVKHRDGFLFFYLKVEIAVRILSV